MKDQNEWLVHVFFVALMVGGDKNQRKKARDQWGNGFPVDLIPMTSP